MSIDIIPAFLNGVREALGFTDSLSQIVRMANSANPHPGTVWATNEGYTLRVIGEFTIDIYIDGKIDVLTPRKLHTLNIAQPDSFEHVISIIATDMLLNGGHRSLANTHALLHALGTAIKQGQ